ncbi:MAG: hypothetical protein OHK0036_09350 [Bacteroidia bacterium]
MRVKKNFTFCYDPLTDYSHSKLNFKGYYVRVIPFERPHYDWKTGKKIGSTKDTIYSNMLFFDNGLFVRRFKQVGCGNCDIKSNTEYLWDVKNNKQPSTDLFYTTFVWGLYKIEGNIVKTQSVNRQSWPNPYWYLVEIGYEITDGNTLVQLYSKDLIENKELSPNSDDTIPFQFIETNILLPSDTWLKGEKWFWCDKEEYKKWKREKRKKK